MTTFRLRGTSPGLQISFGDNSEAPKLTRYNQTNNYDVQSQSPSNLYQGIQSQPPSNLYQGILDTATNNARQRNTSSGLTPTVTNAREGAAVGRVSDRPTDTDSRGNLYSNFDLSSGQEAMANANTAARQAGLDQQTLALSQLDSTRQRLANDAFEKKIMASSPSGLIRDLGKESYVSDPNSGNLVSYHSVYDVFGRRNSDVAKERSDQERLIERLRQEGANQQTLADTQGRYQQGIADTQGRYQQSTAETQGRYQQSTANTQGRYQQLVAEAQKEAQIRATELQTSSARDVASIGANAQIQSSLFGSINSGNSGGRYW